MLRGCTQNIRVGITLAVALTSSLITIGCGSGTGNGTATPPPSSSSATGRGQATLTIRWPILSETRLIPLAANSIRITLKNGGTSVGDSLLPRPPSGGISTVTFDKLPVGDTQISAVAYPTTDGTGIGQARADTSLTILDGANAPLALTLQSTIDHIDVVPSNPSPLVGQNVTLMPTAKSAVGEVVIVGGTWAWSTDNTAVATVSSDGTLTGVAVGTANISVTETESGKSLTLPVTVRSPSNPGDLLLYDSFDYPSGARLENQNGGTGWARGWNEFGQGYTPSTITDTGLTYKNLQTSGRAMQTTSLNPIGHARVPAQPLGIDGTVLYASVLVRPLVVSGGWPDSYFGVGFSDMLIGKPGRNGFFSIEKPVASIVSTGIAVNANETTFLVYRVAFQNGSDRVEMWVNPTPGQPLPAPQAVKTDANVSFPSDVGIGSSVRVIFDEYRIGTTWESVSPTTP